MLTKINATDYNSNWQTPATGLALPLGQTLTFSPDTAFDIGATAANRPRDLFLGRNGMVGGTLGVTGATTLAGLTVSGTLALPSGSVTSAMIADGTIASADMAAGAAATNVGALAGVLGGTLPSPTMAAGAAATNVGTLGGVLGGTLPNPTMTAGAAATNIGALGGSLTGTLPNPGLATGSVTTTQIADGTIASADLANAAVTNAKLGSDTARANLLTNGGFEIWQRGNGPFTSTFGPDRWQLYFAGGPTISVSRDTANADVGSNACAAATIGGSPSAGNPTQLYQYPLTTADNSMAQQMNSRTLTFSARVKTTVANACRLALNPVGGTGAFSSYHPGGGAWATLTVTATMPATTSGIGATIAFQIEANGTFYLDNAMLVVGSQTADYVPLHPADDLARCLRYYELLTGGAASSHLATAQAGSTVAAFGPLLFRVQKAITPTITISAFSDFNLYLANTVIQPVTGLSASGISTVGAASSIAVASGLIAGNATVLLTANANARISVEANP